MEMIFKHIPGVSGLNIAVLHFKVRKPESKRLKNNHFYCLNERSAEHVLWHCFPSKPLAKLTLNQWLELRQGYF